MTVPYRRHRRQIAAAALAASACAIAALTGTATGDNVSTLKNKLGSTQSQLNSNKQHEQELQNKIAALDTDVLALAQRIEQVRSREAGARRQLAIYRARVVSTRLAVLRERRHLAHLRNILDRARSALAAEVVSSYEQPQPSVVSLIIDSTSFQQLLDGFEFMSRLNQREESIVDATRTAKYNAHNAATRLTGLLQRDASAASAAQTQANALTGMTALLNSQESALADERQAQAAALAASQLRGAKLEAAVAVIQKQENEAVAAQRAVTVTYSTAGIGPSGAWSIPLPIVLCESGGQNLPPNSAGASGYYQIIPNTWHEFGGVGKAAYLAPKNVQDAVASRIWNNGAGASNWTCAKILGIS